MDTIVLNPNLAYLILVTGIFLSLLAILSPGTGVLEVIAIFALLVSGWAVYTLPVNPWALAVLLVSAILFVLAVYKKGQILLLVVSILMMVVGSVFLFRGENWWQPAVHPALASIVSLLTMGFVWVAAHKVIDARSVLPAHNPDMIIGQIGEAKTEIFTDGSAQVAGELWSARSHEPIPQGRPVRVTGREGFILVVVSSDPQESRPDRS